MNLKSQLALVLFAALLLLAGCAAKPDSTFSMPAFPETLAPLANTDLKCIRLVADGKSVAVPADSPLTLRLELEADKAVKVSGQSAVNRYFGSFTLGTAGPGEIAWSPLGATRMAGPPERMKLESQFMAALPQTQRLSITAHGLLFHSDDGKNVVEFAR